MAVAAAVTVTSRALPCASSPPFRTLGTSPIDRTQWDQMRRRSEVGAASRPPQASRGSGIFEMGTGTNSEVWQTQTG